MWLVDNQVLIVQQFRSCTKVCYRLNNNVAFCGELNALSSGKDVNNEQHHDDDGDVFNYRILVDYFWTRIRVYSRGKNTVIRNCHYLRFYNMVGDKFDNFNLLYTSGTRYHKKSKECGKKLKR